MARSDSGADLRARDWTSGRYRAEVRCDACGRPTKPNEDRYTDEEVCGSSDGPGFWLCHRVRCRAAREVLSVDERRALYTEQRARNEAQLRAGRRP